MPTSVLDDLTRSLTAWPSFDAVLNAEGGYRPTLHVRPYNRSHDEIRRAARTEILADAYDAAQASRGDHRRAYRGG
jgi:hypothetical protein